MEVAKKIACGVRRVVLKSPVTYQADMLCVAHSSTLGACQLKLNGCPQYDRPQYKSWFTVAAASSSACVHSAESWRRSCGVAGEERQTR